MIEVEKQEINLSEPKIRKGGKQPSGKPPLKHSQFYYGFNTGLKEMDKGKIKEALAKLAEKIEAEYLIIQGSSQGEKSFNLPINDTREKLLLRIEGKAKVKFQFEIGKQSNCLIFHFLYSVSKRALDTQIDNRLIKKFIDEELNISSTMKAQIYRDSKADIQVYSQKANIL